MFLEITTLNSDSFDYDNWVNGCPKPRRKNMNLYHFLHTQLDNCSICQKIDLLFLLRTDKNFFVDIPDVYQFRTGTGNRSHVQSDDHTHSVLPSLPSVSVLPEDSARMANYVINSRWNIAHVAFNWYFNWLNARILETVTQMHGSCQITGF